MVTRKTFSLPDFLLGFNYGRKLGFEERQNVVQADGTSVFVEYLPAGELRQAHDSYLRRTAVALNTQPSTLNQFDFTPPVGCKTCPPAIAGHHPYNNTAADGRQPQYSISPKMGRRL